MRRPLIWVSRCLLGDRVRYDGGHRLNLPVQMLTQFAQVIAICPELEAGLGVPRPPIDIVDGRVMDRAADRDVTALLDAAIDARLAGAPPDAVIGKAKSPSCGRGSARHFEEGADSPAGAGDGRFITRVRHRWPTMLVCDAERLTDDFLQAVWARVGAPLPIKLRQFG
ncbi:MAG: hypothetical protein ACI9U2_001878 [Bradymonadia bacterium]|jgi:uncharacterized protein YbbK (DUF523 family)